MASYEDPNLCRLMSAAAYREQAPRLLALENQHDEGRDQQRSAQRRSSQLPGDLTLPRARELPPHYDDDVDGRQDVEDLEEQVPGIGLAEQVGVSRAEDDGVEDLCYHRDAYRVKNTKLALID